MCYHCRDCAVMSSRLAASQGVETDGTGSLTARSCQDVDVLMIAQRALRTWIAGVGGLLFCLLGPDLYNDVLAETEQQGARELPPAESSTPVKEGDIRDGPEIQGQPTWSEILRTVLLTAVPHEYEDRKHWDKTTEIFDGVKIQQRGYNIRMTERKRRVNHGAWHKFKVELIEPDRLLKLVIDQIRPLDVGRFQFDVRLASRLRCRTDFEHWVLGVKGLNFTTISDADVEVVSHCEVVIRAELNPKSFLPDLVLEPTVRRVELFLRNLRVKRIGEIRGDVAKGIGEMARHDLENLIQAQEGRVVKNANEAIQKKQSNLRLSASKLW